MKTLQNQFIIKPTWNPSTEIKNNITKINDKASLFPFYNMICEISDFF